MSPHTPHILCTHHWGFQLEAPRAALVPTRRAHLVMLCSFLWHAGHGNCVQARKSGEPGWGPKFFKQVGPHNTWTYMGNYWEKREAKDWSGVKDLFAKPQEEVPATSGAGALDQAAAGASTQ